MTNKTLKKNNGDEKYTLSFENLETQLLTIQDEIDSFKTTIEIFIEEKKKLECLKLHTFEIYRLIKNDSEFQKVKNNIDQVRALIADITLQYCEKNLILEEDSDQIIKEMNDILYPNNK